MRIWNAIGWTLLFLFGQIVVAVMGILAMVGVLGVLGRFDSGDDVRLMIVAYSTVLATTASVVVAGCLIAWRLGRQAPAMLGLFRPNGASIVLIVLALLPSFVVANFSASQVKSLVSQETDIQAKAIAQLSTEPWWIVVVFGCLFPGLGEELFFRGFLGRGLITRYGTVLGVGMTSALFGLLHMAPSQIAGTLVFGILFHCAYLCTRSLPAAMIFHFLVNLVGLLMSRILESVAPESRIAWEATEGPSWTTAVGATALLALWGWALARVNRPEPRQNADPGTLG